MQTIDSIRRTNELSKILKQHGFAQDSFEAMSKAQDTIDSQEQSDASTVYDASSTARHHEQHRTQPSQQNDRFEAKIATLERSKHLLAHRVDSLQKELQSTQEHMKQLLTRLDKTESKIRQQTNQQVQAQQPVSEPASNQQSEQQPVQQPAQEQQTTSAPQTSAREEKKVDPAISIENIFNCSGK